ncbi:MAG: bifunctional tRNA (5-methylaminomethyl-2-thiouridine)(34)-methyltransferase MnmD/FAD-dependent 5-carboxymethylaminomethyl-2-thiouridine(34) oxidoreductase MnmC [Gammaproteobacteria bacterium]
MADRPPGLGAARLQWEAGEPVSEVFGDIYFSRGDGLDESRYVFLGRNGLPDRWSGCAHFTIAETGFGTGLNFLAAWRAWRGTRDRRPADALLRFISVERYPLSAEDLSTALARWPELADEAAALIAAYPPLITGYHRVCLEPGVELLLVFADAREAFAELEAGPDGLVDAWFFDGFDPGKNPEMWDEALFSQAARLSRPGATFATFTVAGRVRRALEAAGFAPEKVPGHGRKRQMLRGDLVRPAERGVDAFHAPPPARPPGRVAVIGAGIAGASAAEALVRRGMEVRVFEGRGIGSGASGNPAGAILPAPVAGWGPYERFYREAYVHTVRMLDALPAESDLWHPDGVLQLPRKPGRLARLQAMPEGLGFSPDWAQWMERVEAEAEAGVSLPGGGLWQGHGGWVRPAALCRHLLTDIEVRADGVTALTRTDSGFALHLSSGATELVDSVVLAAGMGSVALAGDGLLPLEPARGQVSFLRDSDVSDVGLGGSSAGPRCVLSHEGYLIPGVDGSTLIGATFDPGDGGEDLRADDDARNLEQLRRQWPTAVKHLDMEIHGARASVRATSPDRLPLVGPLPDWRWARQAYARYHLGPAREPLPPMNYPPGLYVMTGFGSRGMIAAPFAAQLLADRINGLVPLAAEVVSHAVLPSRLVHRAMRRPAKYRN